MNIMICGSRGWKDIQSLQAMINWSVEDGDTVIHGGAPGADSYAEAYCNKVGIRTKIIRPVNPQNKLHYLFRNVEMITMCDKIICFWDGKSTGTKFVIDYAKARGKNVIVYDDKM